MSQGLVMNYRHSSLGQRFTPSPCQEGQGIAGSSLGLEEAALGFPVPAAGSPPHGRQLQQKERGRKEWKDPKYSPAPGQGPPWGSPPGAPASALSVGRPLAPRDAQDTQIPKDMSQLFSTIPFWHASGMACETAMQGPSIIAAHSHLQNRELLNLLGTGHTRGHILYFIQYFILFPTLPCLLSLKMLYPHKCYISEKMLYPHKN